MTDSGVTRINHAEQAADIIADGIGPSFDQTRDWIALAQVHATLALVEQQRIANEIALTQMPSGSGTLDRARDRIAEMMRGAS